MKRINKATATDVALEAPPSKAHTLRAIFLGALADGRSAIRRPLLGADQRHAIECVRRLGAEVALEDDHLIVDGVGGRPRPQAEELNVGESGVTMNFVTAIACLSGDPVLVTGAQGVLDRPIGELVSGLRQLGCRVDYVGREGFPPVRIHGGGIPGGAAEIRGQVTSQYFSAILAAAPYAAAPVQLRCRGLLTERPYLTITAAMMADFGVVLEAQPGRLFLVPNTRGYAGREVAVEGDYSSAALFFEAAAVCGIRVTVTGLNPASVQGDRLFLTLLERMGCHVAALDRGFSILGSELLPVEADMVDTPDLVPPLAVTAAFARGTSRLTGVAHLRHKESDRLAAIVSELGKMGVSASCDGGCLTVAGGGRPHGASIDPHNDHRIAMSFAVAGLAVGEQAIQDEACVAKSFPDFWSRLERFGQAGRAQGESKGAG